ncbi:MAG: hypothetical protein Ct9H300mP11_04230 [Chloroflexota bacterium]|nr:MAG: hypothetical protein Ct9H300mP11_04230 [Chloroflexota bacterium]
MAKAPILGLFETADNAADAGDALKAAGVSPADYDFLTDAPYPEGSVWRERRTSSALHIPVRGCPDWPDLRHYVNVDDSDGVPVSPRWQADIVAASYGCSHL